jgi:putative ABC transport system ATP-binding protein
VSPSDAATVRTQGLVRIYRSSTGPVHALRGLDLTFLPGQVNVVVGPSGSGKSSLLRLLGAVDRPSAGSVVIAGHRIDDWSAARRRRFRRATIAFVLQRPSHNLFEQLDVRQHLLHATRVGRRRDVALDDLIATLELGPLLDRRPSQLSGGEQQRVALAAAAASGPAVLLADEPTGELDRASADRVVEVLRDLAATGLCLVVSSHDETVVAGSDATYRLRDGALQSETRSGEVWSVIDGSGRIQLPAEALARFPGGRLRLRVNGDHVRLDPP